MVSIGKTLQEAINLLGLLGQLSAHQKLSNRHIDRVPKENESPHVLSQRGLVEVFIRLTEDAGDCALGYALLQACQIRCWCVILLAFGVGQLVNRSIRASHTGRAISHNRGL